MSRSGRAETRSRTKDDVRKVMAAVDKVLNLNFQLSKQTLLLSIKLALVKLKNEYAIGIIYFRCDIGKNDGSKLRTRQWKFINGYPLIEKDT